MSFLSTRQCFLSYSILLKTLCVDSLRKHQAAFNTLTDKKIVFPLHIFSSKIFGPIHKKASSNIYGKLIKSSMFFPRILFKNLWISPLRNGKLLRTLPFPPPILSSNSFWSFHWEIQTDKRNKFLSIQNPLN